MRFRPRIGDYVFISRGMTIATMTAITGFRPHIGDYFLSLPSIVMITSTFKPRLSAESLQRYP